LEIHEGFISETRKLGRVKYRGAGRSCRAPAYQSRIVSEQNRDYLRHFWSGYDPSKNPFAEKDHRIES